MRCPNCGAEINAAAEFARIGGQQRTEAQTAARRANGRKGGRPKLSRSLAEIRAAIETNQAEYRRLSGLNTGVIRGATDTTALQDSIRADMAEYNRRSRRDHYAMGRLVSGRATD